jgi:nicotinate-nucleotide adenylyltransferase
MRIAFFGGTFDPIHCGHLRIAQAAADAFALDRVLFAPAAVQPLKSEPPAASFQDRLAMVRLAVADKYPRFVASDLDAPRLDAAPNYTVDTLTALAEDWPGAELFVVAGADSFLDLRRWRQPDRLLAMAQWIVVSRPDVPLRESDLACAVHTPQERAKVHLLTNVHEDVSATELRRRLRAGEPWEGLLPAAVEQFIAEHGLYR